MSTNVELNAFQQRLAALDTEISELCAGDRDIDAFFRLFLERIVALLGVGGGVWRLSDNRELGCACHMSLATAGLDEQGAQRALLGTALARTVETAGAVVLPGNDGSNVYDAGLGKAGVNDSAHALLFVPVIEDSKVRAVLLLIAPTEVDPRAVRGYAGFVGGLCNKAGVFLQRRRIGELESQLGRADRIRQYVSALHSSLDPRQCCYTLANYAQELLGVFRCMAGTFNSQGKFCLQAVSGLESVAAKSSFMRSISEIGQQVCKNDNSLIVDNPHAVKSQVDGSEDLLTAARLYMLQAESLILGVFPIRAGKKVVGALIVEKATEEPIDSAGRKQIEALLAEAASALANSLAYRNLPLAPVVRAVGSARDAVFRMAPARRAIWVTILVMVLAMPFLVKKQLKVVGTAELVPVGLRAAYAGQDGLVASVVTLPADRRVSKGDILATLDTRVIDKEIENVTNMIDATSIAHRQEKRAAEKDKLKYRLAALKAERDARQLERDQDYVIEAPVAGKVITSESVLRQLLSKPVSRGEKIVEIVPDDTGWEFSVNVPEDLAGELLKADRKLDRQAGQQLRARAILNAHPDVKFESYVVSVASRAYVLSTGAQEYRNVIEVRVKEPEQFTEIIDPRQGMEGKVAIECGRHSLAYVLTHELADFVRVSLF